MIQCNEMKWKMSHVLGGVQWYGIIFLHTNVNSTYLKLKMRLFLEFSLEYTWIIVNDGWLHPQKWNCGPGGGPLRVCPILTVFRHWFMPGVPSTPAVGTQASLLILSKLPLESGCLAQQLDRSCQSDASSCLPGSSDTRDDQLDLSQL